MLGANWRWNPIVHGWHRHGFLTQPELASQYVSMSWELQKLLRIWFSDHGLKARKRTAKKWMECHGIPKFRGFRKSLATSASNKQGACVPKIKCRLCGTLIFYHNNSWTYAATHIMSHNIGTPQDIAPAVALASECEANGEPFPLHKLPTLPTMKKELASNVGLMRCTFATPFYGTNTQPFHRIKQTIAKWIAADCLPHRTVETCVFRAMTRSLDLKCPDFDRKAMTSQVRHCPECCAPAKRCSAVPGGPREETRLPPKWNYKITTVQCLNVQKC